MRSLLPVLLLLAGCSSGAGRTGPDTVDAAAGPATELQVELVPDAGAPAQRWTLTCEPTGGDHPDAAAACAELARTPDPLAPLPEDLLCTEVYGGPQTAVVRGTYRGEPVALRLSRTDGCRIEQWDRLGALLPGGAAA